MIRFIFWCLKITFIFFLFYAIFTYDSKKVEIKSVEEVENGYLIHTEAGEILENVNDIFLFKVYTEQVQEIIKPGQTVVFGTVGLKIPHLNNPTILYVEEINGEKNGEDLFNWMIDDVLLSLKDQLPPPPAENPYKELEGNAYFSGEFWHDDLNSTALDTLNLSKEDRKDLEIFMENYGMDAEWMFTWIKIIDFEDLYSNDFMDHADNVDYDSWHKYCVRISKPLADVQEAARVIKFQYPNNKLSNFFLNYTMWQKDIYPEAHHWNVLNGIDE